MKSSAKSKPATKRKVTAKIPYHPVVEKTPTGTKVTFTPKVVKEPEYRKELGRINSIKLGTGGYQDAQFGLSVGLEGVGLEGIGWATGDFKGFWSLDITIDKYTHWTEVDRSKGFSDTMRFINNLLREAKKTEINQLVGVPVEVTFDGMMLRSWRVLTEVL